MCDVMAKLNKLCIKIKTIFCTKWQLSPKESIEESGTDSLLALAGWCINQIWAILDLLFLSFLLASKIFSVL